jgi:hypothetical protein
MLTQYCLVCLLCRLILNVPLTKDTQQNAYHKTPLIYRLPSFVDFLGYTMIFT